MSDFIKVLNKTELKKNTAKVVEAQGVKIAIFNDDGKFYAISNACAHKKGPLAEGEVDDHIVTCPLHGWQFDITTGACINDTQAKVPCYEVKIDGEDLYIKI